MGRKNPKQTNTKLKAHGYDDCFVGYDHRSLCLFVCLVFFIPLVFSTYIEPSNADLCSAFMAIEQSYTSLCYEYTYLRHNDTLSSHNFPPNETGADPYFSEKKVKGWRERLNCY